MCLNTLQNTLKTLFRKTENILTKANFGKPKTLHNIAFRVPIKFEKNENQQSSRYGVFISGGSFVQRYLLSIAWNKCI